MQIKRIYKFTMHNLKTLPTCFYCKLCQDSNNNNNMKFIWSLGKRKNGRLIVNIKHIIVNQYSSLKIEIIYIDLKGGGVQARKFRK